MAVEGSHASEETISVPFAPAISDNWELDFYSRPVLGADGKKIWELILVDKSGTFEHVEVIPNKLVNSKELQARIQKIIDAAVVKPTVIRFFRSQMCNMIQIALADLDIQAVPSRRTYALMQTVREREKNVYPQLSGYVPSLASQPVSFKGLDLTVIQKLPDALRCDSFSFASLPLEQLLVFFEEADSADYFGDKCFVDSALRSDASIPGLIVFSSRSRAISAWLSGIELSSVAMDLQREEIIFECGLDLKYKFAVISEKLREEAKRFQQRQMDAIGVHFIAVQREPEIDDIDGLWLLCDV